MAKGTSKTSKTIKTAPAKKATVKVVKSFKVSFQGVGSLPADVEVKNGLTLGDFISGQNLTDYTVSLNGSTSVALSQVLAKGDVIRVGLKTKNNHF